MGPSISPETQPPLFVVCKSNGCARCPLYRRIADDREDRLRYLRALSMWATNSDSVVCLVYAISFRAFQKASSRLTLVLCPSITMLRLVTEDFIGPHSPLSQTPCSTLLGLPDGSFNVCSWGIRKSVARSPGGPQTLFPSGAKAAMCSATRMSARPEFTQM